MKIFWQNEHYPDTVKGGGGAVNTYYIVTALTELGQDATVIATGRDQDTVTRERFRETRVVRVPRPRLPAPLWPVWPLLEARALRPRLAEVVRDADAFVCSDAAYALSLKRLYPDRPVVCRVEGTTKGYAAAVQAARRWPDSVEEAKRRIADRFLRAENDMMDRLAWRSSDALVVKSSFMKSDVRRLYAIAAPKIHVIPNGVDYARYAAARPTADTLARIATPAADTVVIAFCGRLVQMKNVSFLLQAFARMRLADRCILALVGDGEERVRLAAEATALGVASRVRFVGHTNRPEEFLAASDVFVLPSTYEPFGNALLEAMAAALPTVALRPDYAAVRTASEEIVADGETGFLVDPRDPAALADRLDLLVENPDFRRSVGLQAQRRCRSAYSWTSCASRYVELLQASGAGSRKVARVRSFDVRGASHLQGVSD